MHSRAAERICGGAEREMHHVYTLNASTLPSAPEFTCRAVFTIVITIRHCSREQVLFSASFAGGRALHSTGLFVYPRAISF